MQRRESAQPQMQLSQQVLGTKPLFSNSCSIGSRVEFARAAPHVFAQSAEWYASRGKAEQLSSTRVAAACGLNQYCSTKRLYHLRTGQLREEFTDYSKQLMARGAAEEPVIRRLLRRLIGVRYLVAGEWAVFTHPQHHWLTATPDGFVCDRESGDTYVAEFKRNETLVSEPRLIHLVQVLVQCLCTGAKGGLLFYVSPAHGYRLFRLQVDENMQRFWRDELLPRCEEFLQRVRERREPPPTRGKSEWLATASETFRRSCKQLAHFSGDVYRADTADNGRGGYYLYK